MLRLEMMVDSTLNVKEDEVDEALKAATLDRNIRDRREVALTTLLYGGLLTLFQHGPQP